MGTHAERAQTLRNPRELLAKFRYVVPHRKTITKKSAIKDMLQRSYEYPSPSFLLAATFTSAIGFLGAANTALAGAEARGVGNFYAKLATAETDATKGFGSGGGESRLASDAFLDDFTAAFASDGKYEETAYRFYLEYGVMERVDLLFSLEYKDIEESFAIDFPGLNFGPDARVRRKNDGLGDGMIGAKYQFKDTRFPVSTDVRLIFPNYSTSVRQLNLETINSLDDKVPLGDGLYNLSLGLAATLYPIPWTFVDTRMAFVLSDLEDRDFSDRITWEIKAGGSYKGPGGAVFLDGSVSLDNGSASSVISQDAFTLDPTTRVTVLNDQEFTRIGVQAWYNYKGFAIEATLAQIVDGKNTTKDTSFEIGFSIQR